jgi:hypothetical protein
MRTLASPPPPPIYSQDLSDENRDLKFFWDKDENKAKKTKDKGKAQNEEKSQSTKENKDKPEDEDKAKEAGESKGTSLPYAECVKFNLVRADYLKPIFWTRPFAYNYLKERRAEEKRKAELEAASAEKAATPDLSDKEANTQLEGPKELKELKDRESVKNLYTKYPARMRRFRLLAFLFGVIPEVITLIVVTFAGVQYILWSGFKVGSDSRGMEEIILATLAICFVYDIDETLYAHVLPEIYKTAHERDRFELRGWISSSMPSSVAEAQSVGFFWKILSFQTRYVFHAMLPNHVRPPVLDMVSVLTSDQEPVPNGDGDTEDKELEAMKGALKRAPRLRRGIHASSKNSASAQVATNTATAEETKETKRMVKDFEKNMKITVTRAMKMSGSNKYNDLYLARQYPFFYARKFSTHFTGHLGEGFLVWYGHLGLHFLLLLALALSIVGAYRAAARCDRYTSSSSIWSTQEWPSTCVMNVASQPAAKFKDLRGREADRLMPVSCGLTGYLPREAEWTANKDFFLDKR